MKKFLLYSLKRYIPFYIISFAICVSFILSSVASISVTTQYYETETGEIIRYVSGGSVTTMFIFIGVILYGFTLVLPIIANSYRYSLRSLDLFNQISSGKNKVRIVNNLILLASLILSFTVAYILGVLILGVKQIAVMNVGAQYEVVQYYTEETVYLVTAPKFYNFVYFIPIYFYFVIGAAINYFISYFLVTRANNALNSIILLVLGQLILIVGLCTPIWYIGYIAGLFGNPISGIMLNANFLFGTKTPSMVGVISGGIYLFDGPFNNTTSTLVDALSTIKENDILALVLAILSLAIYIALGALGILYFLKEKESSGEYAGKPTGRDKFQNIIFHTGAGLIGVWYMVLSGTLGSSLFGFASGSIMDDYSTTATTISLILSYLPAIVTFGAIYYVFSSLLKRNFRLKAKDLKILLPVFLSAVAISLVANIIVFLRINGTI